MVTRSYAAPGREVPGRSGGSTPDRKRNVVSSPIGNGSAPFPGLTSRRTTPTTPTTPTGQPSPRAVSSPYLDLLRTNPHYRRLWLGEIASLLGDWFNTIALYTLVRQLTGSPLALGLVFITKMLPFALASPLAGLVTDRFDRRHLMIAADLLRAAVVLGFLFVDSARELPLLYTLAAAQMVIGAVFIPARSASIPNITTPGELLTANALSAATWSTLLAVGAGLGGFVTAAIGTRGVFALDSVSYLVSASFILRTVIPQHTDAPGEATVRKVVSDIVEAWRRMVVKPGVGRIALAKASWALGGGALVYMLTLLGEELSPAAPAVGMGLLFSARGLGTGLGPILGRRFLPEESRWPTMIGLGIIASGITYLVTAALPWSWWVLPLVLLAHTPSGANWVFSTVLLQRRTEDRYRGRIFSTEWLLVTLADTVAILSASLLLDLAGWGLRPAIALFATLQVATGVVWLITVARAENRAAGKSG